MIHRRQVCGVKSKSLPCPVGGFTYWWIKISHSGTTIQRSTGTEDKSQAQEYDDKLKASLWEQQRLGVKPRRGWKEAVVRWLAETSEKATHQEDVRKLRWLDPFLGNLMLDDTTLDVIDGIKAEKLKTASKATVNRYLALVRAILLRSRDEWEWLDNVPKVKLFREGPGRERSITVEEAETLLAELPEHQRDVVVFALATDCGNFERYAHLAPDHLAKAASRLDSLFGGYDLATPEKEKRPISRLTS
jgi:integrase